MRSVFTLNVAGLSKLAFFMLLLVLCSSLHTSTTFNQDILKHYVFKSEVDTAYKALWPAAKNGSDDALHALVELAKVNSDVFWLEKAASLQSVEAQLYLVELASSTDDKIYWWQQAAQNGNSESQFELALLENNSEQRIAYLKAAAQAGYTPAVIALAKIMYDSTNTEAALFWLRKAAEFDVSSQFKLAKMLWAKSEYAEAKQLFSFAAQRLNNKQSTIQNYADVSANYQPQSLNALWTSTGTLENSCSQQLQFVATSLESAVQAQQFQKALARDKRLSGLPICTKPVLWLKQSELTCQQTKNRQTCDLSVLAKTAHIPAYTHLVLFLPTGTAYVQSAVMYLDQADVYSVFVHELAHFVGFVDEYAVSEALAQQYCYDNGAPNLIVNEDIYTTGTFAQWQAYAESMREASPFDAEQIDTGQQAANISADLHEQTPLQLSPARTCSKLGISGVKPSNQLTFLEYHDTENIPPIYLAIWQDLLADSHQDFAIAAHFQQLAEAQGWAEQASHWASLAN